jgi:aminopeptidase N
MRLAPRWSGRIFVLFPALIFALLFTLPAPAAERPRIQVDDYQINVELLPARHHLVAKAQVRFTALDDVSSASFELHNSLKAKAFDVAGKPLPTERILQENAVRVSLPELLPKGKQSQVNFEYEGDLATADESPVEGLKLAYIDPDTTYLLYAGRWFPVVGYGNNRFSATINVTLPTGMTVIGSGRTSATPVRGEAGKTTVTFSWPKTSFPGTIIAGKFEDVATSSGGLSVHLFVKPDKKPYAQAYLDSTIKEMEFFSSIFGPVPSTTINVVQLPDDTVPMAWAPEIAALSRRAIVEKTNYRLLADSLAHQWWGVSMSPARPADAWLTEGAARFAQALYVDHLAGQTAYQEEVKEMSVGALAYDTVPISGMSKLDPFSAEFQSLATNKGGVIFHMLRYVFDNDELFNNTLRVFAVKNAGKAVTGSDFQKEAEQHVPKDTEQTSQSLTYFFSQWTDSSGAPEFKNKYTVYRAGKGFRVVGQIQQDLDLFRMPVELRIDTDGKTETKRIEVTGTQSPYSVETFGKPRRITIDPNGHVLKETAEIRVRVAIQRGQDLVAQNDFEGALREFQKALDANKNSSLGHYRIGEVFFLQKNYQSAANEYRASYNGDGEPRWTEVWSHVQLGKIFDVTGQRDRATNEYRRAIETNDNTQGALDEARKYLRQPYTREQQEGN